MNADVVWIKSAREKLTAESTGTSWPAKSLVRSGVITIAPMVEQLQYTQIWAQSTNAVHTNTPLTFSTGIYSFALSNIFSCIIKIMHVCKHNYFFDIFWRLCCVFWSFEEYDMWEKSQKPILSCHMILAACIQFSTCISIFMHLSSQK